MIVLDLDGPILDGRHRHYECYRQLLVQAGATPLSLERYWRLKRQGIDRRKLLAETGAEGVYDQYLEGWLATIETPDHLALDRLQPGALDTLQAWHAVGEMLVLITARREKGALMAQLKELALFPLFSAIVATPFAGTGDAKANAFVTSLGDVACRGWVGDTEVDIDAARRLGVTAVAVTCGLRNRSYLQSFNPDFLLSDLRAVRTADPFDVRPSLPERT